MGQRGLRKDCITLLTSSTSVGKILRVRRPSENLFRTLVRPFINAIFSSRDFVLKTVRSRKLSVDIGREEKKGWDGSVTGVGRCCDPRVIIERSKAFKKTVRINRTDLCHIVYLEGQCPDVPSLEQVCRHYHADPRGCHDS